MRKSAPTNLRFLLRRATSCALALLLSSAPAAAAELFYLDHDSFNNQYTGPVGPLVLSGEILPGDYAKLLARIAENPERFLERNKIFLASGDGNAAEAIKIAKLLRALYTEVIVGPLTGRCVGACFLIYAAASARGTDSENLLGIHRLGLAESEWLSRPTSEAALIEDSLQAPVRDFLTENDVPSDLVDELFKHPPTDVYWLTAHDEKRLGVKSTAFQKFLAKNCAWDDALEKAVLRGERIEEMKALSACRVRLTLPAARKALAQALKEKALEETAPGGKLPESKAEHRRCERLRVVFPQVRRRLLELVREQAEPRDVGGPSPSRRLEGQKRHLENVARARTLDEHRPGDGIDSREIEPAHVVDRRRRGELIRRGVGDLELERLARCDARHRPQTVVPAQVALMNGVSVCHAVRLLELRRSILAERGPGRGSPRAALGKSDLCRSAPRGRKTRLTAIGQLDI
jgi:hypothetical protein